MRYRNTHSAYGVVAKGFHWILFLMITGMVLVGFIMADMDLSPDKVKLYGLHKSTGIVVLALVSMRLAWKFANVSPLLPDSMHALEKFLARAGHAMLYLLMFAMPLTGWMMSSAAGFPVSVYGLFTLPDLVAPDTNLKALMIDAHFYLAWLLVIMVGLHVLAALTHHFYYRNNILRRMLPFTKEEKYAQDSDTMVGC
jgi:cytochrome b561